MNTQHTGCIHTYTLRTQYIHTYADMRTEHLCALKPQWNVRPVCVFVCLLIEFLTPFHIYFFHQFLPPSSSLFLALYLSLSLSLTLSLSLSLPLGIKNLLASCSADNRLAVIKIETGEFASWYTLTDAHR